MGWRAVAGHWWANFAAAERTSRGELVGYLRAYAACASPHTAMVELIAGTRPVEWRARADEARPRFRQDSARGGRRKLDRCSRRVWGRGGRGTPDRRPRRLVPRP